MLKKSPMFLFLTLLLLPLSALAAVNGTVLNTTSYPGGRLYVSAQRVDNYGGSEAHYGVSVDMAGQPEASFTIRGIPDGTYVFRAYRDISGLGLPYVTSPRGETVPVTVTGGVANPAIVLADPLPGDAQPLTVQPEVIAADSGAVVHWEPPRTADGLWVAAESYDLEWSLDSFATVAGSIAIPQASWDSILFVNGLTNGATYQFRVTSHIGALAVTGPAVAQTIGAPVGGHSVSGTVNFSGFTPQGPLYLVLANDVNQNMVAGRIASPSGTTPFTLTGAVDGIYRLYLFVDMNDDGVFEPGTDVQVSDSLAQVVAVAGADVTGVAATMTTQAVSTMVRTAHWYEQVGESYNISPTLHSNGRQVVNVAVSGPQLQLSDLALGDWAEFRVWTNVATRPQLGDSYSFVVAYGDGTSETLSATVNNVLDASPTPISPLGAQSQAPTTFAWNAPTGGPPLQNYSIQLWDDVGTKLWDDWEIPADQTSIPYGGAELVAATIYTWQISARDIADNEVGTRASFSISNPLAAALGIPGNVVTGGDSGWFAQASVTHDAGEAAQSGVISDLQTSWMETTLTGPGTLSFWWKVSSEPSVDSLTVAVDGIPAATGISGENDWQQVTLPIDAGQHVVRWQYAKDDSLAVGTDAGWVDHVIFSSSSGDMDGDGIPDEVDNCSSVYNPNQSNFDSDGQGDLCDADDDNDGIADIFDGCPYDMTNSCGDGDGDGISNSIDNCPTIYNPTQSDSNGNGIGDACDEANPPTPATVSGSVVNGSGQPDGRVFVRFDHQYGGESGLGVSIAAPGSFTVRGVTDGTYVVRAFMDANGDGMPNAGEPAGETAGVVVSGGILTSGTLTVSLLGSAGASAMPAEGVWAGGGDGLALVTWDSPHDNAGFVAADSYRVEWSSDNFANVAGSKTLAANFDDVVFISGLTNGSVYSFRVVSILGGSEAATVPTAPVTIAPPSGTYAIAGTVTLSGFAPAASAPLYIAAVNDVTNTFFLFRFDNPYDGMSYVLDGIPNGTYRIYAIVDSNDNGTIDSGDVMNGDRQAPFVAVNGSAQTGIAVIIDGSLNVEASIRTIHQLGGAVSPDFYYIDPEVRGSIKKVVNVSVEGPQVPLMDLALSPWGDFYRWQSVQNRPTLDPADTYTVTVSYLDGSSETLQIPVTAVLDNPPVSVSPIGTLAGPPTVFSWQPSATVPSGSTYRIWLEQQNGGLHWESEDIPTTMTSVTYDGPELQMDVQYYWRVTLRDMLGNEVSYNMPQSFTISSTADFDNDGFTNDVDPDDDNDGLSDIDEAIAGTNPFSTDTDGDGVGDGVDSAPLTVNANFNYAGVYHLVKSDGSEVDVLDAGISAMNVTSFNGMSLTVSGPNGFTTTFSDADIYPLFPNVLSAQQLFPANTLQEGLYTFTLTDGSGVTLSRSDTHGNVQALPQVDPATIKLQRKADGSYRVTWAAVAADRTYFYRLRGVNAAGQVTLSAREMDTWQDLPAGMLVDGQSYQIRVEVSDAPSFDLNFNRSNSPYVSFVPGAADYVAERPLINFGSAYQSISADGLTVTPTFMLFANPAALSAAQVVDTNGNILHDYNLVTESYPAGTNPYLMASLPGALPGNYRLKAVGLAPNYAVNIIDVTLNAAVVPPLPPQGTWQVADDAGTGNLRFTWADGETNGTLYYRMVYRDTVTGQIYRPLARDNKAEATVSPVTAYATTEWRVESWDSTDPSTARNARFGAWLPLNVAGYDASQPQLRYAFVANRNQPGAVTRGEVVMSALDAENDVTQLLVDGPNSYHRDLMIDGKQFVYADGTSDWSLTESTPLEAGLYTLTAIDATGKQAVRYHMQSPTLAVPAIDYRSFNVSIAPDGATRFTWAPAASDLRLWYRLEIYTQADNNGDGEPDQVYRGMYLPANGVPLTTDLVTAVLPTEALKFRVRAIDGIGPTALNNRTMSSLVPFMGAGFDYASILDSDVDGVVDPLDNCVDTANLDQADSDGNGIGDACEGTGGSDYDGDGITDNLDNCPVDYNPGQEDFDLDGSGDLCDNDADGDGYANVVDAFPWNPLEWADDDGDLVGNNADNCLTTYNPDQVDSDLDGVGDACEGTGGSDYDADGIADNLDNCPLVFNPGQADSDGDGIGDVCDSFVVDTSITGSGSGTVGGAGLYPYGSQAFLDPIPASGSVFVGWLEAACQTQPMTVTGDQICTAEFAIAGATGFTLVSYDKGLPGIDRIDGANESNNYDMYELLPRSDIDYRFIIVWNGSPSVPQVDLVLDGFRYPMDCLYDEGLQQAECTRVLQLGAAVDHTFHYESGLGERYPEAGELAGPTVELLTGYNMISVPRNTSGSSGLTLFGSDALSWLYDATKVQSKRGSYVVADSVVPGSSYFVMKPGATLPDLTSYNTVTAASYDVVLQPGWNLIGNPYGAHVNLADCSLYRDGVVPVSWAEAANQGWVYNALYAYNGSDFGDTYRAEFGETAQLVPWVGYWLYLGRTDGTFKLTVPNPNPLP